MFEQVLEENGVRLKATDRDRWTYSMRRDNNGKWGRKKASALTPEFTAAGTQQIFEYHAQKGASHGVAGHDEPGQRAAVDYGDVEEWTSRLPTVEQQLSKLTNTVADLTAFVKVMDKQQEARMKRL